MDKEQIKDKTRGFIRQYVRNREVADDLNMFESGVVNSMFAMQLVTFVESSFTITVEDDELELTNFQSIDAITDYVHGKLAGAGA